MFLFCSGEWFDNLVSSVLPSLRGLATALSFFGWQTSKRGSGPTSRDVEFMNTAVDSEGPTRRTGGGAPVLPLLLLLLLLLLPGATAAVATAAGCWLLLLLSY